MNKKVTFSKINDDYHDFLEDCDKYCFLTRSKAVQKQKIDKCSDYIEIIRNFKFQAQKDLNESASNVFFHMQCVINALKSFLLVWVQLEEKEYYEAWVSLIDAQEYTSIALKVETDNHQGILNLKERLEIVEKANFPSQNIYMSGVFSEKIGNCSICNQNFNICTHIENNIYMGKICYRINREIIDVISFDLVKQPRDRRCIVRTFSNEKDNEVDRFTLEETGKKSSYFESVVFRFPTLDVL